MNRPGEERAALHRLADGEAGPAQGDVSPLIRRGTRVILVLLWLLGGVAALLSGWFLIHHAKTHTQSSAVGLEQFARRTISLAAFAVDEYQGSLRARGGVEGIAGDPEATQRLRQLVGWLPAGSVGGLVMPDGTLAVSSIPVSAPPPNLADRRWFEAISRENLKSYVGPAVLGRVNPNFYFTYSAPYLGPDGQLLALINLGIPSDSITGLSTDQHSANLALLQHEGPIVAAQPFSPSLVGKSMRLPARSSDGEATEFGTFFDAWSLGTVRDLPDLALYAVAALPITEILEPLFWGVALGLPLLLLLTYVLLALSDQLQNKSRQVEQALSDNKVLFQEVHHRVKNNLQTISALLRLQSRRLQGGQGRDALLEAERRVRSIALVHEILSREPGDQVPFRELVGPLVKMAEDSVVVSRPIEITYSGDLGETTADVATPLAVAIAELLQNAVEHAFSGEETDRLGHVFLRLAHDEKELVVEVRDDGQGLPEEFELDSTQSLGLSLVRDLVRSQLAGEISMVDVDIADGGGTKVTIAIPRAVDAAR